MTAASRPLSPREHIAGHASRRKANHFGRGRMGLHRGLRGRRFTAENTLHRTQQEQATASLAVNARTRRGGAVAGGGDDAVGDGSALATLVFEIEQSFPSQVFFYGVFYPDAQHASGGCTTAGEGACVVWSCSPDTSSAIGAGAGESSAKPRPSCALSRSGRRLPNDVDAVHGAGLEPARLSTVEPKSTASAISPPVRCATRSAAPRWGRDGRLCAPGTGRTRCRRAR